MQSRKASGKMITYFVMNMEKPIFTPGEHAAEIPKIRSAVQDRHPYNPHAIAHASSDAKL